MSVERCESGHHYVCRLGIYSTPHPDRILTNSQWLALSIEDKFWHRINGEWWCLFINQCCREPWCVIGDGHTYGCRREYPSGFGWKPIREAEDLPPVGTLASSMLAFRKR